MSETELKSCPFCGGTDLLNLSGSEGINCRCCHAQVIGAANTSDVDTWNRRAPADAGDAIRVKALEWSEIEHDRGDGQSEAIGEWEAPSLVGVYAINISTCGDMHAPWEVFGGDDNKIGNFETLIEAKAAAQSHFEAAIRSTLVED